MTITEPRVELHVVPLSGTIGAEIHGLDVRHLDDDTVAAIRQVWLERKVVFFPDQHLDPTEHLAFASRFGQPTEGHPVIRGIDGHPEVFEINYTEAHNLYASYGDISTRNRGIHWHTDVTFVARPPLGSILRAVVVPSAGGDTLFSDQQAAFDGLSPALQSFLSTLTAVHDGRAQFQGLLDRAGEGQCKDLDRSESDALLEFLYAHSVKPDYTVRYHWHEGDIGFWDNRTTQHAVAGDFGDAHRVIQRVTLRGDEPV